jgi:hypothetical protein
MAVLAIGLSDWGLPMEPRGLMTGWLWIDQERGQLTQPQDANQPQPPA